MFLLIEQVIIKVFGSPLGGLQTVHSRLYLHGLKTTSKGCQIFNYDLPYLLK